MPCVSIRCANPERLNARMLERVRGQKPLR